MAYLHGRSPPVLHRDLKSPNVLLASVDGRLCAKVADFGVAQAIASRGATGRVVQNPTWLAPEIMRGEEYVHFC
jgi:serine/threonine protein kinase